MVVKAILADDDGLLPEDRLPSNISKVFTPKFFGAIGDGVTDDSDAVQLAINAAVAASGVVSGINGETYAIGAQVNVPAGSFSIDNIKLVGLPSLSGDYLLSYADSFPLGGRHAHTDVKITRSYFDADHNGGCIYASNYLRFNITDCTFVGFSTYGIRMQTLSDAHECIVTSCHFAEYPWPEPGIKTGTAIEIDANDNQILNCVIASSLNGVVIKKQYNTLVGTHIYGCTDWGIDIAATASWTLMSTLYIDSVSMRIIDPWHTEITSSKFLHNTSDTSFKFIVLRPSAPDNYMYGFKVYSCSFHNIGSATVESIGIDTSVGSFSAFNCKDNYVDANSFSKVNKRTTKPIVRRYITSNSATFNLDSMLIPGPAPVFAKASFLADSSSFDPTVRITTLSRTATTVTLGTSGNGIIMLTVDCNIDDI